MARRKMINVLRILNMTNNASIDIDGLRISRARDAFFDLTGKRPVIMGIVNVTPDSFSDGGLFTSKETAVRACKTARG